MKYKPSLFICVAATLLLSSCNTTNDEVKNEYNCDEITVVSYGGGKYRESQREAFIVPFGRVNDTKVSSVVWDADYAVLETMVKGGDVKWDVVEVTAALLERGLSNGLYEKINTSFSEVFPDFKSLDYGIPNIYWGTTLAHKKNLLVNEGMPSLTWADFFDIDKFPGNRALHDDPRSNIEFALIADGVDKEDIYPFTTEKVDRAFKKLSSIKEHISVWWTDGSKPIELLLNDQVTMSSVWNGRVYGSETAKQHIEIIWDGAALDLDYWVIPKGSKCINEASQFIAFSSMPEPLSIQAKLIGYGPANSDAVKLLNEDERALIPTYKKNHDSTFTISSSEWAKWESRIRKKWVKWRNE